tara:strand:- start:3995 stop:4165 length:171 start_codon:yes stop_codon:yes gene_type:complete
MKKRNNIAKALWEDKRYMHKVCPNKKERKQYEKVLKRMDKEAKEVMKGYLSQYDKE